MSDWFTFSQYFSDWWFNFIMITWLYYFLNQDTKMIAIIFLIVNTREDKKRMQIVPVLN